MLNCLEVSNLINVVAEYPKLFEEQFGTFHTPRSIKKLFISAPTHVLEETRGKLSRLIREKELEIADKPIQETIATDALNHVTRFLSLNDVINGFAQTCTHWYISAFCHRHTKSLNVTRFFANSCEA